MSESKYAPIKVGMLGMSINAIAQGEQDYVWLPIGVRDSTIAGGRVWVRVKVTAVEPIREQRDIIVANEQLGVKEHTPVELSYQTDEGPYQRVTESFPLPVTTSSRTKTFMATATITATGDTTLITPATGKKVRVSYIAISNAHTADVDVGLRFGSGDVTFRTYLALQGGNMNANLIDCPWEGKKDEALVAWANAAYASGVYFTIGYEEI